MISDTAVIPSPGGYTNAIEYLRSTYINLPRTIPVRCNTRSNMVSVFLREVSVRRQHHKIENISSLPSAKYRGEISICLFVILLLIIRVIESGGIIITLNIKIFPSNTINDENGKLMKSNVDFDIFFSRRKYIKKCFN